MLFEENCQLSAFASSGTTFCPISGQSGFCGFRWKSKGEEHTNYTHKNCGHCWSCCVREQLVRPYSHLNKPPPLLLRNFFTTFVQLFAQTNLLVQNVRFLRLIFSCPFSRRLAVLCIMKSLCRRQSTIPQTSNIAMLQLSVYRGTGRRSIHSKYECLISIHLCTQPHYRFDGAEKPL